MGQDKIIQDEKYNWEKFRLELAVFVPNHRVISNRGKIFEISKNNLYTFVEELLQLLELSPSLNSRSVNLINYLKKGSSSKIEEIVDILTDTIFEKPRLLALGDTLKVKGRNYLLLSEILEEINGTGYDVLIENFEEVRLLTGGTLYIDCDLDKKEWHGVNISVRADTIIISGEGEKEINVSGLDASNSKFPASAPDGEYLGRNDGVDGKDGDPGGSGGNVYFFANQILNPNGGKCYVISNGGHGANGQNGGNGANGKTGKPGKDGNPSKPREGYILEEKGGPGSPGGRGGNGGEAGLGGAGGNEGNIEIGIENISTKILHYSKAGKNGQDGKNGTGGIGGLGGRKGVDCVWYYEGKRGSLTGDWFRVKGDYTLTPHVNFQHEWFYVAGIAAGLVANLCTARGYKCKITRDENEARECGQMSLKGEDGENGLTAEMRYQNGQKRKSKKKMEVTNKNITLIGLDSSNSIFSASSPEREYNREDGECNRVDGDPSGGNFYIFSNQILNTNGGKYEYFSFGGNGANGQNNGANGKTGEPRKDVDVPNRAQGCSKLNTRFLVDPILVLKAGDTTRQIAAKELGEFVEPEILLEKLRPGDLIEFNRGTYCHWAMYSDEHGYIFNVRAEDKSKKEALISHDILIEVADLVRKKRKVRINNLGKIANYRELETFSAERSVEIAKKFVGKIWPYDFLSINCEFYCTKWKFGYGFTEQGQTFFDALSFDTMAIAKLFGASGNMVRRGITSTLYDKHIFEANKKLDHNMVALSTNRDSSEGVTIACNAVKFQWVAIACKSVGFQDVKNNGDDGDKDAGRKRKTTHTLFCPEIDYGARIIFQQLLDTLRGQVGQNVGQIQIFAPNDPNNPIRESFVRRIDHDGLTRVEAVDAFIAPVHDNPNNRNEFPQEFFNVMYRLGSQDGDERFHLVASEYSGPPELYNMIPGHRAVNRNYHVPAENRINDWRSVERSIRFHINNHGHVRLMVFPYYESETAGRPAHITFMAIFYDLHGREIRFILAGSRNQEL